MNSVRKGEKTTVRTALTVATNYQLTMSWHRELAKLGALFRRRKPADDLAEEIRSHLEMEEQENLNSGMPPDEAHYAALRRFGNVTSVQDACREMWGWNSAETLWQDLRFGLRQLRKNPGFTSVAVVMLALGIGANTAIFSAVNALLLNPFPFPEPDRIIGVDARHANGDNSGVGYRDFLDWRNQNDVFEEMAITGYPNGYTWTGQGEPQRIVGGVTTFSFLKVLGIQPLLGRFYAAEEDKP